MNHPQTQKSFVSFGNTCKIRMNKCTGLFGMDKLSPEALQRKHSGSISNKVDNLKYSMCLPLTFEPYFGPMHFSIL